MSHQAAAPRRLAIPAAWHYTEPDMILHDFPIPACPRCGRVAERDFRFCPSCGRLLDGISSFEEVLDGAFTRIRGLEAAASLARLEELSAELGKLENELEALCGRSSAPSQPDPIMEVS